MPIEDLMEYFDHKAIQADAQAEQELEAWQRADAKTRGLAPYVVF